MVNIGGREYNCHPALEEDIKALQGQLDNALDASMKASFRADELSRQVASLRVKLDRIATFDAYDEQMHHDLEYRMRVSRIQLHRVASAKAMVDYIIETFREKFYQAIEERAGK